MNDNALSVDKEVVEELGDVSQYTKMQQMYLLARKRLSPYEKFNEGGTKVEGYDLPIYSGSAWEVKILDTLVMLIAFGLLPVSITASIIFYISVWGFVALCGFMLRIIIKHVSITAGEAGFNDKGDHNDKYARLTVLTRKALEGHNNETLVNFLLHYGFGATVVIYGTIIMGISFPIAALVIYELYRYAVPYTTAIRALADFAYKFEKEHKDYAGIKDFNSVTGITVEEEYFVTSSPL